MSKEIDLRYNQRRLERAKAEGKNALFYIRKGSFNFFHPASSLSPTGRCVHLSTAQRRLPTAASWCTVAQRNHTYKSVYQRWSFANAAVGEFFVIAQASGHRVPKCCTVHPGTSAFSLSNISPGLLLKVERTCG